MAVDIWEQILVSRHIEGRNLMESDTSQVRDTLHLINRLSSEVGVSTLLCGSFSLQLLTGIDLNAQDLDFFVVGPVEKRLELQNRVAAEVGGLHPKIDFSNLVYGGGRIVFGEKYFAVNSGIKVPINPVVFDPVQVDYWGINVPVMHPQTQLALMLLSDQKQPKILDRMTMLAGLIEMGFYTYLPEDFSGFEIYKAKVAKSLIKKLNNFRRSKYLSESEGHVDWYTGLKLFVKTCAPTLYEKIRNKID